MAFFAQCLQIKSIKRFCGIYFDGNNMIDFETVIAGAIDALPIVPPQDFYSENLPAFCFVNPVTITPIHNSPAWILACAIVGNLPQRQ